MPEATPRERMTRKRPSSQRGAPSAQPPERQKELSEEFARATAELGKASGELSAARTENRLLREKVDALIQRLFGAQSQSSAARQPAAGSPKGERSEAKAGSRATAADAARLGGAGKSPGARGGGGTTALDGSIASAE